MTRARPELEGARDCLPIAIGIVPFGFVAGATAADAGFGLPGAMGFSLIVFAGASQLAAIDLLHSGAAIALAVTTAWLINLRFVMYSASLAPHLGHVPLRRRALVAYVLTDQSFALSLTRYGAGLAVADRVRYYLGTALPLWVTWQVTTILGALVGQAIPEDIPLDFTIPLCFLVLVAPAVTDRPAAFAALVGGVAAVVVAGTGLHDAAVVLGAIAGIAAGTALDTWKERIER